MSLQEKHYLVSVPRAGRETVEVRIQGRAENTTVPVKRMSPDGGDYLDWTADGTAVTWAWGAQFFRQGLDAAEPQKTDVVVELPRARPAGSVLLTGARIITMKGDEVIARGDLLVTNNRIAAVGRRGSLAVPARRAHHQRGRQDHHARPRGRARAHVGAARPAPDRGVAVSRQPRLRRDDDARPADLHARRVCLRRHGGRRADAGPRVYATGPGVFSGSGIEDRDAAFRFVKRYKEAYRTNTLKQYVAGDRIVRQWIIEACQEYGITATIEGSLDLKLNLTQMADGYSGQEHSFPLRRSTRT